MHPSAVMMITEEQLKVNHQLVLATMKMTEIDFFNTNLILQFLIFNITVISMKVIVLI
jgi:hypothetical protein